MFFSGVHNIMQESLRLKGIRYRDQLMQISLLCRNIGVADYVTNLEDLERLLERLTPSTREVLEHCFMENCFTK